MFLRKKKRKECVLYKSRKWMVIYNMVLFVNTKNRHIK